MLFVIRDAVTVCVPRITSTTSTTTSLNVLNLIPSQNKVHLKDYSHLHQVQKLLFLQEKILKIRSTT